MQSQTESLHTSLGLVREASQTPPAVHVQDSGERDLSDQLLETWMLLEYCDQGNLESAARESRFKNDFVSALATAPVSESRKHGCRPLPPDLCKAAVEQSQVCRERAFIYDVLCQSWLAHWLACAGHHLPVLDGHCERHGLPSLAGRAAWYAATSSCETWAALCSSTQTVWYKAFLRQIEE